MSRFTKIDDVSIQIFDGANYFSWKYRIMNIFEYKECSIPATREIGTGDDTREYNKMDLKARTLLISAISDKQLEFIKNEKSVLKMIEVLDKIYSTKSTPMQILCRTKIEEIRMKN